MKKDALKRYTAALNEMLKDNKEEPISGIGNYAQVYGMSDEFFTFLVHQGTLLKTGDKANARFSFTPTKLEEGGFTENQVTNLMLAWNRFKKSKGKDEGAVHDLSNNSKFAGIETKELLAELKRRGYSGTLEIITVKTVKL
jgi:hypothetical protein